VNRYALARDASAEMDRNGDPVSEMQIWVSKNEDDSKRLPSRSRLVVLLKKDEAKNAQMVGKPSGRERSMQMIELLAGCLNADDERNDGKQKLFLGWSL
jgi:hypothetical protein